MTDDIDFARRHELAALRREVRVLTTRVDRLCRRRDHADAAMEADFLVAVGPFACGSELGRPWSASELLEDARHARRLELLAVVERITGGRGDEVCRLGIWLSAHAGGRA